MRLAGTLQCPAERILEAVDRHLESIVSDEVHTTPVGSHSTLEMEEKGCDWIARSSGWI